VIPMIRVTFQIDGGPIYSANMRYLRQQILLARDRGELASPLIVTMPAPDLPEVSVDAFLRLDDLYLYGVRNRHAEFYFADSGPKLIGNQQLLGFTGHYNDLASYIDIAVNRGTITAAITQISQWRRADAITSRRKDRYGVNHPTSEVGHLLILILMTSEAARFFAIEQTVANALDHRPDTPLNAFAIEQLTHQWGRLSEANDFRQVAIMKL
jgi:Ribosome inactivating protein